MHQALSVTLRFKHLLLSLSKLSVTCANGDESGINKFYVSAFSMINDPGIDIG